MSGCTNMYSLTQMLIYNFTYYSKQIVSTATVSATKLSTATESTSTVSTAVESVLSQFPEH